MNPPIRFAVIGLDHWYSAIDFAKRVAQAEGAELVGIADRNEDHAREVAEACGNVPFTTDLMSLITAENVDAIAAYASVEQNPELVIAAAKAGKHIVSIKPMARTLEDATRIVEAVTEAGVAFIPSESRFRITDATVQLKTLVEDGTLGKITSGNFLQTGGGIPTSWPTGAVAHDGGWFIDADRAPGGGWIDHSIYQIDRLRYVLGQEVVSIQGKTSNFLNGGMPFEDWGHAIVEFDDGAVVAVEDTWSGPAGAWRNVANLHGSAGVYDVDSLRGDTRVFKTGEGWSTIEPQDDDLGQIEPILQVIRGEVPAFADVHDGWANLAVCLAFYEAAEKGTTVKVPTRA